MSFTRTKGCARGVHLGVPNAGAAGALVPRGCRLVPPRSRRLGSVSYCGNIRFSLQQNQADAKPLSDGERIMETDINVSGEYN